MSSRYIIQISQANPDSIKAMNHKMVEGAWHNPKGIISHSISFQIPSFNH